MFKIDILTSGIDYRIALLSINYTKLLNLQDNSNMHKLSKELSTSFRRTFGRTDTYHGKAFLLKREHE